MLSVHLEAKTAYLAEVLHRAGANVIVTGSNPLSTQDDVAGAALVEMGLTVCVGMAQRDCMNTSISSINPWTIIRTSSSTTAATRSISCTRRGLTAAPLGGTEETTTGVNRLHGLDKAGELKFPMVAANDSYCKYLFDNRYGTGQSTWDGIMRTTNLTVVGKKVVVAGYG